MPVNQPFNAQGVDPAWGYGGGDPVWAAGWSKAIITASDSQEIADKTKGTMLKLTLRCVEGPDNGKNGTIMVNLWHNDPVVKDRAIQQMAAICFAVGVFGYNSTAELHDRPFWIENSPREREFGNPPVKTMQNQFSGVKNLQGVEPGKSGGAGATSAAPQQQPQYAPPPQQQQQFVPGPQQAPAAPAAPQGNWQPPNGAPAAPSQQFAPAPAGGPAPPQGGWAPPNGAPPQQQQFAPAPQQQQFQQQPQPAPGNWQPQGGAPAGGPGWGPRQ